MSLKKEGVGGSLGARWIAGWLWENVREVDLLTESSK